MNKLIIFIFFITFIFFINGCFESVVEYKQEQVLEIPKGRIENLEIKCGSGDLDINSVHGITKITATAEIVVKEKSDKAKELIEKNIVFKISDHGNRAVLTAELKNSAILFYKRYRGYIHINLRVPTGMNIKVIDSEGGIYASDIRNQINIFDGDGDIEIEDMRGDLEISDRAGDIFIKNLIGNLRILDGGGKIVIKNITGKVKIEDKGGDIEITTIKGNVELKDGDGKIFIENVKGNVEIKEPGKGDTVIKNVTGMVIQKD